MPYVPGILDAGDSTREQYLQRPVPSCQMVTGVLEKSKDTKEDSAKTGRRRVVLNRVVREGFAK